MTKNTKYICSYDGERHFFHDPLHLSIDEYINLELTAGYEASAMKYQQFFVWADPSLDNSIIIGLN